MTSVSIKNQPHTVHLYKVGKNSIVREKEICYHGLNREKRSFVSRVEWNKKKCDFLLGRYEKVRRDGNTKRAKPLKKIAELKKAKKKIE